MPQKKRTSMPFVCSATNWLSVFPAWRRMYAVRLKLRPAPCGAKPSPLSALRPRAIRIGSAMLSGIRVSPLLSAAKSDHAGVAPLA